MADGVKNQLKMALKRGLNDLGYAIVGLSRRLGENMQYDAGAPTSYLMGPTLVHDMLRFHPEMVTHLIVCNRHSLGHYHNEVVQTATELGIPMTMVEGDLFWNGRMLRHSIVGEFTKWEDELQPGSHLVFVNPTNPANVGGAIRSALGFGIRDIAIVREEGLDTFSPTIIRSSMGARTGVRVEVFPTFEAYQARFPENHVYPFMLDGATSLADVEKRAPFTLVFGNETLGLPAEYATYGQPVFIEQNELVDSLNVSVAASLGIYEFTRACPTPATR